MAEAAATKSTYILNHIVSNHDGCNYGHIAQNTQTLQQNIQSAVDTTIHIAEERHLGVINELVDSAEQAHALRMSELARQANEVLMKQASDHALLIDIRSQDERAKAEWAQHYAAQRDLAAYEGQAVLTARIQQLELELRSKDEVAARIAMQRDCEAHEFSARIRRLGC